MSLQECCVFLAGYNFVKENQVWKANTGIESHKSKSGLRSLNAARFCGIPCEALTLMKGMPFTSGRHFAVLLSRFQRNVDLFLLLSIFLNLFHSGFQFVTLLFLETITVFTITSEIHARSLANFYCQYADRHMTLKFMRRVSEREPAIRQLICYRKQQIDVI